MRPTRRAWIGGAAATTLVAAGPVRAQSGGLRQALDAAAAARDPGEALALLAPFRADALVGPARLDLVTARAGLAVDREIVCRFADDPRAKSTDLRDPGYYALLLRRKLGDGASLRSVEAWLDAERARCMARATMLFDRLDLPRGSTGARFSALWHDERRLYADDDAGRDRAVADMNRALARCRAQVARLFGPVPAYCLNVAAQRSSATAKPGTRTLPTPTSAGAYTVDLDAIRRRPSWTFPSVVAHELLPGHMLQMPMEATAAPHPLRLDYAGGFSEGWGIYAEQAIATSGAYAGDPYAELGYLHWRLFRIGRALVDLGIHLHDWSVEQARAKLAEWQGEPAYFAPFDVDLKRIAQEPAVRAAEMLAALALEDGARGKAGARRVRFHQAMLVDGRMRSEEIALAAGRA